MPLEKVEEVLSVLGYKAEDFKDADELKVKVESDFVRRNSIPTDIKKTITANMAKSVVRDVKWLLSNNSDLKIEDSEIEGKEVEDIVKLAWGRREEKYKADLEALQESVGKPNEALSKLQKEKEKIEAKYIAESEKVNKLLGEFETYKTQTTTEYKQEKLGRLIDKAHLEKVKFPEKVSELEKEGYWRKIEKNYKLDLDDSGSLIVMNKEGQRIPGKAANSFKSYEEILEEEGIKNNVWSINSHARNQNPVMPITKDIDPPAAPSRQRVIAKPIS